MITVSGNLFEITGSASTGFVRFWLRGTGGNQPFVSGTALLAPDGGNTWYADFIPNGSGAISGNLYSTSDVTVGGVTGAIYYGMQVFQNGFGGPESSVSASGNININSPNILTNLPVVSAPTGDSTYARLDSTNQPFTGSISSKGISITSSGVFTNTQMNEYSQSIINNLSPLTEFQQGQGANYATEGLVGAVAAPNSSSVFQVNGVSGYITNAGSTTNAVAGYLSARALTNGAPIWAGNCLAMDGGFSATMLGLEVDTNIGNTGTTGSSVLITGAWTAQPTSYAAIHVAQPGVGKHYTSGLTFDAGSAGAGGAINIYQLTTGSSQSSMSLNLWGSDSGGIGRVAGINADLNGNILLTPNVTTGNKVILSSGALVFPALTSASANPAASGNINLAKSDAIAFRNNANSGDVLVGKNTSDLITIPGTVIGSNTTISSSGKVTQYNGVNTVSAGIPAEYATVDLTGQTAAISATTLYSPTVSGLFRISFVAKVTTAASVSSTLGALQIIYTDPDDSVAVTTGAISNVAGTVLTGNTTQIVYSGSVIVNAKASTNIQYQFGYTSSGTAMAYSLHMKLEAF